MELDNIRTGEAYVLFMTPFLDVLHIFLFWHKMTPSTAKRGDILCASILVLHTEVRIDSQD